MRPGGGLPRQCRRAFLFLGFLSLNTAPARTQEPVFERLTIDQGLAQNTVYSLLQDRLGFLWIGTDDGLNRYDGYSFEVLRHETANPNSLSNNEIRALHEDKEGMLWIGTGDGLNRYDRRRRTFTHYRHDLRNPTSLGADFVTALLEDRRGTLWVGTKGGGLSHAKPGQHGVFSHLRHDSANPRSLSNDIVRGLYEDRQGNLWVGTQRGLNRIDATGALTRYLPDPKAGPTGYASIGPIVEDAQGRLWLGTWSGLLRFDPATGSFLFLGDSTNASDPADIRDIHQEEDGTLWLSTGTLGLLRFDPVAGRFVSTIQHDPVRSTSLSGNDATALLADRSGAFWVGTSGKGLNKLDPSPKPFAHFRAETTGTLGLSDNMVTAIYEDRKGILWVGTQYGGLNRLDRQSGNPPLVGVKVFRADLRDPKRLAKDDVRAILEDSAGVLWVGTESGGLHRLNPDGSFTRFRHDPNDPDSLRDDDVWVLFEDSAKRLWVGSWGGGLSLFDSKAGAFRTFLHDEKDPRSLASNVVRAIYEDRSGALWIGTGGGGVDRFRPRDGFDVLGAGQFEHYAHDPQDPTSLSSDQVLSILEDRAGTLWFGTYGGGLNRLTQAKGGGNSRTSRYYTRKDGLPNDVVYGIVQDDQGFLWMSTNGGLSRFDPRNETFRNYDVADGLQSREFNSGASFKSPRGELFFGGINGLNAFFPSRIVNNPYPPPVYLTSFRKFNREVTLETEPAFLRSVTLLPGDSVFSFEFAALSYRVQHKNQYAYRLVGFHDEWTQLGTKRDVTFTNLSPGNYTLEVRAANDDGVWNENGFSLQVVVQPPFWRTWWFVSGTGLGVVLLLSGGYKRRISTMRNHNRALQAEIVERLGVEKKLADNNAELEARNAEMERFVYTVSHDLRTPLITIKGYVGMLEREIGGGTSDGGAQDRMAHDLARIGRAADNMRALLEDLLQLARTGRQLNQPEPVALTQVAGEAMALVTGGSIVRAGIVSIEPTMPHVMGDRARLIEVYQNLIDNALKFMGDQMAPRVEVGARREGTEVLCFVRDNGIGIDERHRDKIFGLFERLDQRVPGTGVGLALVKRVIEAHRGRVWVESPGRGAGSSFYFTLPPGGTAEGSDSGV